MKKGQTKGHNSATTDRSQNFCLYDQLHIEADHMQKFEQNPPRDIGGVEFTRLWDGRTDGRTSGTLYA